MIERPPVMIGVPINKDAGKYLDAFIKGVKALDYPRYELVFSDNSGDEQFIKKLQTVKDATVLTVNSMLTANEKILASMKQLRVYFLKKSYFNFLLVLESDIVPQPSTLQVLVDEDKDVIGCPYPLSKDMMMINVYEPWGEPKNIHPTEFMRFYKYLPLLRVWSCGFGCTLIKKHIVATNSFNLDVGDWRCVDSVFARDLCAKKIPIHCKMDHSVKHLRVKI